METLSNPICVTILKLKSHDECERDNDGYEIIQARVKKLNKSLY